MLLDQMLDARFAEVFACPTYILCFVENVLLQETIIVGLRKDFVAEKSQGVRLCRPFSSVRFLAHADERPMLRIEGERKMRCVECCAPILHCLETLLADRTGRD